MDAPRLSREKKPRSRTLSAQRRPRQSRSFDRESPALAGAGHDSPSTRRTIDPLKKQRFIAL